MKSTSGNASDDALAKDLSAFGIDLRSTLGQVEPTKNSSLRTQAKPTAEPLKRTFTILSQARNPAAHGDESRRQKMKLAGIVLTVVDTLIEMAKHAERASCDARPIGLKPE